MRKIEEMYDPKDLKGKRFLYHATETERMESIVDKGLKPGWDGVTYLTDSAENALKFMLFRVGTTKFTVIKIPIAKLDKSLLAESFDHSEAFFHCQAWMYAKAIPFEDFADLEEYDLSDERNFEIGIDLAKGDDK